MPKNGRRRYKFPVDGVVVVARAPKRLCGHFQRSWTHIVCPEGEANQEVCRNCSAVLRTVWVA